MSDVSVTASAVQPQLSTQTDSAIAGGTITAGEPLYSDSTDNFYLKAAQSDSAAHSQAVGIALHGASRGQPIRYAKSGPLTFNAALTAATVYVISANAGGIAPVADLATGNYTSIVGVAASTTVLNLALQAGNAAHA